MRKSKLSDVQIQVLRQPLVDSLLKESRDYAEFLNEKGISPADLTGIVLCSLGIALNTILVAALEEDSREEAFNYIADEIRRNLKVKFKSSDNWSVDDGRELDLGHERDV